jgi:hypothetical protein
LYNLIMDGIIPIGTTVGITIIGIITDGIIA